MIDLTASGHVDAELSILVVRACRNCGTPMVDGESNLILESCPTCGDAPVIEDLGIHAVPDYRNPFKRFADRLLRRLGATRRKSWL